MQRHFSRIALAVLLCLIVLGCTPSPQNQKFYIAELPSSSECCRVFVSFYNGCERVADISSSQESLRGRTRADVARSAFQDEAATSVEEFE